MKYFIFLLLTMISTHVLAQSTWHTSKVSEIYPLADGRLVVIFQSDHPNCTNGNSPNYYFVGEGYNGVTKVGFNNMYSALLTAGAAGKDVAINFDSSSPDCDINRLYVSFQ